jgi:hypothetical protein
MSVWTFKKINGFSHLQNTTPIIGEKTRDLAQICSETHSNEPDSGNFWEILVFPIEELDKFDRR